jgi:hypothetical protein
MEVTANRALYTASFIPITQLQLCVSRRVCIRLMRWPRKESRNSDRYLDNNTDHSGRAVWGMNCLPSLGRWDRWFESHSGHGYLVCVCVYSVFVLSCVYAAALRRADHSSKKSYRLWRKKKKLLRNRIRDLGAEWSGRAIEKNLNHGNDVTKVNICGGVN